MKVLFTIALFIVLLYYVIVYVRFRKRRELPLPPEEDTEIMGRSKFDIRQFTTETDKNQVGIEIHSGRNRVVRRIFESLGYRVVKLDRVYFAGLTKKNLPRGRWRHLIQQEVNFLKMGSFE